jgi:HAD superfamily hydrolase (TIGR01509 family)
MLNTRNFSAVIFDMDGLVLDSETAYFIAWQQAAVQLGYSLSEEFCLSMSGFNGQDIKRKLQEEYGDDFDFQGFNETANIIWREHIAQHGVPVKRGFHELLAFIIEQGLPYCLATNSRKANALECLEKSGLSDVFSIIISRDDVAQGKPAPDIFFIAAQRLQVPIQRCLVLEDSHTGIVAATTAGAFAVFVPSVTPANPLTIELCAATVPDLVTVLQALMYNLPNKALI